MTQQDFKRFRRRNRRPAAAPEAAPDSAALPPQAAPAQREQLPALLPEAWDMLRRLPLDPEALQHLPVMAASQDTPSAKAIGLLRTRLLHTLKARGWRRVAVTAPTSGCGATFTALNLALSLARVPGSRTVLMDLNLRRPGVARALGVAAGSDMPAFLTGQLALEHLLLRASGGLAVGLNAVAEPHAAEILHGKSCAAAVDGLMERTGADVALFDLPPVLEHDDVAAFLPQVDGVLLVADGTQTTAAQLAGCEKMLAGHTELLGVALNRARR